jgi:predicted 3-demethylubiquinone-9 3-methyltransferase (glyoxalase superfamily)
VPRVIVPGDRDLPGRREGHAVLDIVPKLRFDSRAEQAAEFYCSVFKDSRIVSLSGEDAETLGGWWQRLSDGGTVVVSGAPS